MKAFNRVGLSTLLVCLSLVVTKVMALTIPLPKDGNVVGQLQTAESKTGETLADVGRRYDIGSAQMKSANPKLTAVGPLKQGIKVLIPSQFILPDVERKGIVINLAEQRLYYFPADRHVVMTAPVGIGKEGQWQTPIGLTKIVKKESNPLWHPTANVRAEAAKNGTPIPYVFPAGPNNPLGKHILRLSWATYLIHGTNHPETVGGRVSAGCIRMLPDSIAELYQNVSVGTVVRVINEPYKMAWKDKHLWFEAHKVLQENQSDKSHTIAKLVEIISNSVNKEHGWVNWQIVKNTIKSAPGYPQVIGSK